ncbi:MAG: hypothetical protein MR935_00770 [Agathobaculum sp.]|uniref:JAB domain-containing protein n=1 Tax=Agathobaculum sp. TaxID=2048138 RepID=UPI0025BDA4F4|nr:JAB domain-containing protein [Agathobaculum sp.]MCI7124726.1 hypothetical protein [Agathobaculum sp.]MDY3711736.1 JAB domain-containing protein [Agathobaculum sp.]
MAEHDHADHRSRMLGKFRRHGLEVFEEHEVLEMLLFFAIPRKDTNAIAHRLIARFGSLHEVFEAPYEQLLEVAGIGPQSATMLKLVFCSFGRYQQGRVRADRDSEKLTTRERVGAYFVPQFFGKTEEMLMAAYLEGSGRVIKCEVISHGSHDRVLVDGYNVARRAMLCGAHGVALAHNHPNGRCEPSQEDIELTRNLIRQLAGLGIQLVDHCVVVNDRYCSICQRLNIGYLRK